MQETLVWVNLTRLDYFRMENGSSSSPLMWRMEEQELESREGLLYIPTIARDQVITVRWSGSPCCRVAL